jgi:hypothetical protein
MKNFEYACLLIGQVGMIRYFLNFMQNLLFKTILRKKNYWEIIFFKRKILDSQYLFAP